MRCILIRHGQTQGNLERRYVGGCTDEPLCEQGAALLRGRSYPRVGRVYASPMLRCLQTAAILYPGITPETVEDFRECNFGLFEGKNFAELQGLPDYQAWLDSRGTLPFPEGESREAFAARCVRGYERLIRQRTDEDIAIIAHGGTIMSIMEKYACPSRDYFDFQVENGEGFILHADGRYRRLPL